jgi:hypothetical protein
MLQLFVNSCGILSGASDMLTAASSSHDYGGEKKELAALPRQV